MKMKVILVSCLIFGVAQATLPGFGGSSSGSSSGGGGLNILGDLTGVFGSLFRSLSGGQSNHDHSTSGEVVDGQGGGISGGSSDFGGYAYSAPATIDQGVSADGGYDYKPANPQPAYGAPQAAQAVAPQENYGPPQQQYGAPAPAPQQQYGAPQAAQAVAPQESYGPPQQQYGAPAPAPQQQYGAPQAAQQVAPAQNYGPPSDSYGAPAGGHSSSGGHSSGGQSHGSASSSSSSSSGESSGSGFDLGGTIVKFKTGLLNQGRSAANKHFDRKENALTSISGVLGTLFSSFGGSGSSSGSSSESDSYSNSGSSGSGSASGSSSFSGYA